MPPFNKDPFSQSRNNTPFEKPPKTSEKLREVPFDDERYLVERAQLPKFNFDRIFERYQRGDRDIIFSKFKSKSNRPRC